jgi:hypothetical protein
MTPANDPVTFIEVEEPKAVSVASIRLKEAQAEAAARPIRVRVNAPYRVVHEGKPFVGGDRLTVPPHGRSLA